MRNWLIGYRIAEEELKGEDRAKYGAQVIKKLSKELLKIYGKGFTERNLYSCVLFYQTYPDILQSVIANSRPVLHTEKEDCYIDLVFYDYILKCFDPTRLTMAFKQTSFFSGRSTGCIDTPEELSRKPLRISTSFYTIM